MRDETCLRRQWALLRALASRHFGLTVRQMADEVGVTTRTIRRDLDVFRTVGFPLEEDVGDFGRKSWRIKGAVGQPALGFNFDEAVALYLGRRLLDPLAGTPFGEAARSAFQKIRASLGAGALAYLERFAEAFYLTGEAAGDYAAKADLIDGLMVAIEDGKVARILYRSERSVEATHRDVHPYGVAYHRGSLYIVALDPDDRRVKHYKLARVEAVEVGPGTFRRPSGFDLSTHMAAAFGVYRGDGEPTEVRVRFTHAAARYVQESRWHESQRLTPLPEGDVLAVFRVSGTEEIKRWILGFGSKAVVLGPEPLREEIAAELRALVATYSAADAVPGIRPMPDCSELVATGGAAQPRSPDRRGSKTQSPRS